ncbi:cytochrome P450 [Streptomyces sp. NPDC051172]|uniref:cytochrome P450 n=1 Tax=Streptomyces sp. NPDC051172 TaxID=3155796 RepID=UPI003424A985
MASLNARRGFPGDPAPVSVAGPPVVSGALPVVGHGPTFLRDPVGLLERGHAEHGRVFALRMGRRPVVVVLGAEHNRRVLKGTGRSLSIRSAYPFFVRMFDEGFYFFAGEEEYRRQRDLVLPRFQSRQLDAYVTVMEDHTRRLMDRMGERGELDLVDELGVLVMRIAADAFLGADASEHVRGFFPLFRAFSGGMDPVLPGWLPVPRLVRSRRAREVLRRDLLGLLDHRRRHPVDPPDFLQMLAESRYADGGEVSDLVLANLVLMLIWAGHETTTGHLAWAFADLLSHPGELERVRVEAREAGAWGGGLSVGAVHRLAYLERALRETERLHPVAFMLAREAVEAMSFGGYRVEAGTMVFLSPAISHRLAQEYPDPGVFRPDRFLDAPQGVADLIGFGGGLHRCLGVRFAYLEMKVVMTLLLQRYDFTLVDEVVPVRGARTRWPTRPCRVRYRLRAPGGG